MGVSEYFDLVREKIGFLLILAFVMPAAVRYLELENGEDVLLFASVIGAAGGLITFEGITFDFQFFSLTPGTTLIVWFTGMIVVITNVVILFHVWQYSLGNKNRKEVYSSIVFMVALSLFLGGLELLPIPWVAIAAVYRVLVTESDERTQQSYQDSVIESSEDKEIPAKESVEVDSQEELEEQQQSQIFEPKPSMSRRLPKFFAHGFSYSILDLLFGIMWPILTGVALATGELLGSTGQLVAIAFSFGSLFIGSGLINAWLSEKIWDIKWDYGIGIIFLSGVIMFVVTQILVSPLSFVVNTFLMDSSLGVAIIVIFRYTVVALFLGIVGLLISFNFRPTEKSSIEEHEDFLSEIEDVIEQTPESEYQENTSDNDFNSGSAEN